MIGPVYVVSDPDAPIPVSEQARAAARGGAWAVQLRDKTAPESKMARMAAALLEDLGPLGVRVFVNDRLEVARQTGADLHIGQGDGDPRAARDRIGPDAILGLSIETAAQCAALPDGVDYIGAGPGRSGPPRRNPTLRHPSACRGSSGSCRPARCLLSPLAG